MTELNKLKEDVRRLYDLSNKSDELNQKIRTLKEQLVRNMSNLSSKAKFDFGDKKIYLSESRSRYISKKLISNILIRNYPQIDQSEFLFLLDQELNKAPSHKHIIICRKHANRSSSLIGEREDDHSNSD